MDAALGGAFPGRPTTDAPGQAHRGAFGPGHGFEAKFHGRGLGQGQLGHVLGVWQADADLEVVVEVVVEVVWIGRERGVSTGSLRVVGKGCIWG